MIPKTLQQSVRWKQLEHEDFQATSHEAQNMLTLQATPAKDHKDERYEVDCPKPIQCSRRNKYVAIQAMFPTDTQAGDFDRCSLQEQNYSSYPH
jgi:hypothetical protein